MTSLVLGGFPATWQATRIPSAARATPHTDAHVTQDTREVVCTPVRVHVHAAACSHLHQYLHPYLLPRPHHVHASLHLPHLPPQTAPDAPRASAPEPSPQLAGPCPAPTLQSGDPGRWGPSRGHKARGSPCRVPPSFAAEAPVFPPACRPWASRPVRGHPGETGPPPSPHPGPKTSSGCWRLGGRVSPTGLGLSRAPAPRVPVFTRRPPHFWTPPPHGRSPHGPRVPSSLCRATSSRLGVPFPPGRPLPQPPGCAARCPPVSPPHGTPLLSFSDLIPRGTSWAGAHTPCSDVQGQHLAPSCRAPAQTGQAARLPASGPRFSGGCRTRPLLSLGVWPSALPGPHGPPARLPPGRPAPLKPRLSPCLGRSGLRPTDPTCPSGLAGLPSASPEGLL